MGQNTLGLDTDIIIIIVKKMLRGTNKITYTPRLLGFVKEVDVAK